MAKEIKENKAAETAKKEESKPLTIPDQKVDTVKEAAARIARGEKVRHPGPWVPIKPRAGLNLVEEVVQLQKEKKLIGFDPKTGMGILVEPKQ